MLHAALSGHAAMHPVRHVHLSPLSVPRTRQRSGCTQSDQQAAENIVSAPGSLHLITLLKAEVQEGWVRSALRQAGRLPSHKRYVHTAVGKLGVVVSPDRPPRIAVDSLSVALPPALVLGVSEAHRREFASAQRTKACSASATGPSYISS